MKQKSANVRRDLAVRAIELRNEYGLTMPLIGERLKVPASTLIKYVKQYKARAKEAAQ